MNEIEQTERERWQHLTALICDKEYAKQMGKYRNYQKRMRIFDCMLLLMILFIGFILAFSHISEALNGILSAKILVLGFAFSVTGLILVFWSFYGGYNLYCICHEFHFWDDGDFWGAPIHAYSLAFYTLKLSSIFRKLGYTTDSKAFRAAIRYLHGFYSIENIIAFYYLGAERLPKNQSKAETCLKVARLLSGKE